MREKKKLNKWIFVGEKIACENRNCKMKPKLVKCQKAHLWNSYDFSVRVGNLSVVVIQGFWHFGPINFELMSLWKQHYMSMLIADYLSYHTAYRYSERRNSETIFICFVFNMFTWLIHLFILFILTSCKQSKLLYARKIFT